MPNLKYDEETGLIYFKKDGEWKEWIQAYEMATEYVLYSNPTPTNISDGTKLKLSDSLSNYTYYYVEFLDETGGSIKFVTDKVSTDTLVRMSYRESGANVLRYRDITAVDNVNKTITLGVGYQNTTAYAQLALPTKIVGIGKKTIY